MLGSWCCFLRGGGDVMVVRVRVFFGLWYFWLGGGVLVVGAVFCEVVVCLWRRMLLGENVLVFCGV